MLKSAEKPQRTRVLVTFHTPAEKERLRLEGRARGLCLAAYVRMLVVSHPDRARGQGSR